MKIKFIIPLLLLCGCEPVPQQPSGPPEPETKTVERNASDRFTVRSWGKFNAGYSDNVREILTLTDSFTGQEYLCITGVGVTELRKVTVGSGDNKRTVTKEE